MNSRKLGSADFEVSEITFGAWAIGGWMWGGADKNDAIDAINASYENGIDTIDTAPAYGFGRSEEIVGEAIAGRRDKFKILTKFGLSWYSEKGIFHFDTQDEKGNPAKMYKYAGKERVIQECEDSLKRLRTDYIDLYQIHWPDPTTPIQETFEAAEQLIKQGKVRAVGVCNYNKEQMIEANKTVNVVTNQIPYSMLLRDIEKEVMPWCKENGKGLIPYSPLQRGLLTGKITEGYVFNEGDHRPGTPHFKKGNIAKTNEFLSKIKPIAQAKGCSLAQLVINWTLAQPAISTILVGARDAKQARENAKAVEFCLNKEEVQVINGHLAELKLDL
ncbi:MAG: aldo/keto reductase [Cyclobacteriaceae bacterium]|nr:aldo/keto reductase [Cyclobacteriaceae bacterium]